MQGLSLERMVRAGIMFVAALLLASSTFAHGLSRSNLKPMDRLIEVDNVKLHYVESGSGPTIVLLHGNAGSLEDFQFKAIDVLSTDYHVIAIDRPGHGSSDRPATMNSPVEDQANLIHEALQTLGIERPVIVGHSWGAALALDYALKFPDDLSGLVLLAPAVYPYGGEPVLLRTALKLPVIGNLTFLVGSSIFARGVLRKELTRAFYPEKVPDRYFKMVSSSWLGRKQLHAYLDDEMALNDFLNKKKDQYRSVQTPTVIVTGDEDKIVSASDNAFRLQKTLPNSRLIELKNTGHEIPQTRPESIARALDMLDDQRPADQIGAETRAY